MCLWEFPVLALLEGWCIAPAAPFFFIYSEETAFPVTSSFFHEEQDMTGLSMLFTKQKTVFSLILLTCSSTTIQLYLQTRSAVQLCPLKVLIQCLLRVSSVGGLRAVWVGRRFGAAKAEDAEDAEEDELLSCVFEVNYIDGWLMFNHQTWGHLQPAAFEAQPLLRKAASMCSGCPLSR